jgi:hypothetical protein
MKINTIKRKSNAQTPKSKSFQICIMLVVIFDLSC